MGKLNYNRNNWKSLLKGQALGQYKNFEPGDTLEVKYETLGGYWKVRIFEGLCIAKRQHNGVCRYSLYTVIKGTKIVFSIDADNPHIIEMTRLKTNYGRYNKAKLRYLLK
jgi:ribosomal protein L19